MGNESKEARDLRRYKDHARMVAGDIILSCFPDGWTSVNFKNLDYVIKKNASLFAKITDENVSPEEADRRLRAWKADVAAEKKKK